MAARSVKSEPLKLTGVSLFKLGTNADPAKGPNAQGCETKAPTQKTQD
jgi:hypothetical protein